MIALVLALLAAPEVDPFGTAAPPPTPKEAKLPALPARYLIADARLFSAYGVELLQDGKEVGPGVLALDLHDAVRGTREAEEHARHATAWAAINLGLAVAAGALIAGSLIAYDSEVGTLQGWPDFVPVRGRGAGVPLLSLGWLIAGAGSVVARYMTYEEIILAVDAHNRATITLGP